MQIRVYTPGRPVLGMRYILELRIIGSRIGTGLVNPTSSQTMFALTNKAMLPQELKVFCTTRIALLRLKFLLAFGIPGVRELK